MDIALLHTQVSYIFETESTKLRFDQFGNPILSVESWEGIDKMLSLFEFPDQQPIQATFGTNLVAQSPLLHLEIDKAERLIENVYQLTFISFYPNIIISLNLDLPEMKAYRFVVENRNALKSKMTKRGYLVMKLWINYYYGMLGKNSRHYSERVTGSGYEILNKLIIALGDDLIYADVDTVFFTNSKNLNNHSKLNSIKPYVDHIGLPYQIEYHEGAIFFGKKKYILFPTIKGVNIKGFKKINFGI